MVDVSIPAPDRPGIYFPDTVILYGVKLNTGTPFAEFDAGENGSAALQMLLYRSGVAQTEKQYSIVLGYGYAFEGHCYRLDTKRVFIVKGARAEEAVGCGFDLPANANAKYHMWRVRSSEELLEITLNYGDVKKLILDANLPGRRSPSSYAITAALAHRDGRLNRD
ncbi:hypothetical protein [Rhizobium leguminosarum]|uniref:hypothetical protein n=1 Tax=Rhizobium TaxID=379 RepID=UPI00140F7E30|nr:hypothetical protein [Rhizobium leguminosarum]QIO69319.1 hypothetical protein HA462_29965 [Rhizobium leguminosarum bv. trifolii]